MITHYALFEGSVTPGRTADFRARSREVTQEIVANFFEGRIHHHVTTATHFAP